MKRIYLLSAISLLSTIISIDVMAGLSMSVQQCDARYGNPESTENTDGFHERNYRIRGGKLVGSYEICVSVLFYRGIAVATQYVNMKGSFSDLPFNIREINSKGVKTNPFNEKIQGDKRPHRDCNKEYMKTGFMRYASSIRFMEDFIYERMCDWGI